MFEAILVSYAVAVALMLGSFINLAADRLPRGESLVSPASHCRSCNRRLNAIDLIPVAGYFVRGGRCATCKAPIGLAAPAIEALCGGMMLVAALFLRVWPGVAVGLAMVATFGLLVSVLAIRRRRRVTD